MNILPSRRQEKPKPLVPVISHWKVPGVRKMRGKRYNDRGEYIGPCGPVKPVVNEHEVRLVKEAHAKAAKLPPPRDTETFSIEQVTPLAGRLLCRRPELIKEEGGVRLPEDKWKARDWFIVVRVGAGVTICQPGDRVVFARRSRPRAVRDWPGYYLGRQTAIAACVL